MSTAPPQERTDVLTPGQIERYITTTLLALRVANDELRTIAETAARAEVAYKVQFAQARVTARVSSATKVSNDQANDHAVLNTEKVLLDYKLADHALLVQRELIRSLGERLGGLRTLAAGVRTQT